jgi:hypothetical protein
MSAWTRRAILQGAVCAKAAAATKSGARSGTRPGPDLTVFRYGAEPERGSLAEIYRQRTGLLAPGEDMGGWYDDFCPGAHFGQYVSAPARFAAVTRSELTRIWPIARSLTQKSMNARSAGARTPS